MLGSPVHEAAAKTRLPKNFFFFFKVHLFRIASVSTGLQKTGFTLSTRITPIVCWRLILSPTSSLQPGHPAWMCLQHVIPLCGPQQKRNRETEGSSAVPTERERCFKIWQCHLWEGSAEKRETVKGKKCVEIFFLLLKKQSLRYAEKK